MACRRPYPFSFTDIKLCAARMHKVKLPEWVLLMQMAIALQGSATVRTRVNHGEAVKVALLSGVVWASKASMMSHWLG